MIYSAGLRISEVINLRPSDIDSDRKQVRVLGKGNKYRYTLLSGNTLNMLRMYWRAYKPVGYLFEGQKKGQPISRGTIQKVFKESCKRAGVKKQAINNKCKTAAFIEHVTVARIKKSNFA